MPPREIVSLDRRTRARFDEGPTLEYWSLKGEQRCREEDFLGLFCILELAMR